MTSHRLVRQLGWLLLLLDITAITVSITLISRVSQVGHGAGVLGVLPLEVAFLGFSVIGALIVFRRPQNTVGWIFCIIGLGTAFTSFSAGFVQHAIANHSDGRLIVGLIDVLGNTVWPMNLGLATMLLYLFPTGRLLSPRWRFIFWLDVILSATSSVLSTLTPGYLESGNRVWNPLGISGAGPMIDMLTEVGGPVFVVCALASAACIIVRYITSRDVQRQQIKWFALGTAAMVAILIPSFAFIPDKSALSNITFAFGILMLPIGAGIGILRYRLFDIDVIINRTLVYGSLTAVLAAIYFAGVLGAQQLTRALTGQEKPQSPVVIVVTTLLIAALFQPLRRSIQRFIDKRFYRSRYDVKKTLDRFSSSLRSQIELNHLTVHLLETVEQTMHPAHVSLWLRTPESERPV
ncbi:MAG TPA: hypothetical protein VFN11_09125 [Ktedonobacterales bacterium]|nr:hypothetical protein [Ktedonobacterales bacterium]